MKIPLTKGKFALVDPDDYRLLSERRWHLHNGGYAAGVTPRPEHKKVLMHRVIMDAPDDKEVDHINGDKLDNRKSNLRLCTPSQNKVNKDFPTPNGFRGIVWLSKPKRWRAQIHVNNKCIALGQWVSKEVAAKKYNEAALKYYGEFARLNHLP